MRRLLRRRQVIGVNEWDRAGRGRGSRRPPLVNKQSKALKNAVPRVRLLKACSCRGFPFGHGSNAQCHRRPPKTSGKRVDVKNLGDPPARAAFAPLASGGERVVVHADRCRDMRRRQAMLQAKNPRGTLPHHRSPASDRASHRRRRIRTPCPRRQGVGVMTPRPPAGNVPIPGAFCFLVRLNATVSGLPRAPRVLTSVRAIRLDGARFKGQTGDLRLRP
jgi:hypothetical protein